MGGEKEAEVRRFERSYMQNNYACIVSFALFACLQYFT